jgi:hypothetical protein
MLAELFLKGLIARIITALDANPRGATPTTLDRFPESVMKSTKNQPQADNFDPFRAAR